MKKKKWKKTTKALPPTAPTRFERPSALFWMMTIVLSIGIIIAYSNHFSNSFHFDDIHTIVDNPHIRSLSGIPRFFTDSTTFSSRPSNVMYRPMVTLSLAFDYWLGGGLNPYHFHLSAFIVYLAQCALMFFLFLWILLQSHIISKFKL